MDRFLRGGRRLTTPLVSYHSRRPILVTGIVLGAAGMLGTALPARADIFGSLLDAGISVIMGPILVTIVGLLYMIVQLLLLMNYLFAWLLVSFAQFNTFVAAKPVLIGWPLVRDVVNMFFIVVLLVVAFSTIIGYEDFNYKKVLPKLLLMAVLINFSKTLVGLMIDFSQVITLTFVNGFKAAAFGNFAKAFGLTNILSVISEKATEFNGELLPTIGNILISLIFGIVLLTITATVLLIMSIYFLVRIVLLWMLIIFSPVAFFALALPGKLQKSLGSLGKDWWQQLGTLLSGGPIVAFFLWLTLAVVQGSENPFPGLYQSASPTEEQSVSVGITEMGKPSNVTTLLVAVIMMLTGLKTAVQVSKEAAPKLGQIAESIKKGGGPAGLAARLGYRGARAGARVADRRWNISGRLGTEMLAEGQRLARSNSWIDRLQGATSTRLGSQFMAIGAKERSEVSKAYKEGVQHLGPAGKKQSLDAEIARADAMGNFRARDALLIERGVLMKDGPLMKAREDELKQQYMAAHPLPAGATDEQKADQAMLAEGYAKGYARREAAEAITAAVKAAEEGGQEDLAKKLKDAQAADPSLFGSHAALSRVAANKIDDFAQAFRDVKTEGWGDSGTFLAYMRASGLIDEKTGKMVDGYKDSDAWKELTKNPGSNRAKYAMAHAWRLEKPEGQAAALRELAAMKDGASEAEIKAANESRYYVSTGSDGKAMVFANVDPKGTGRVNFVPTVDIMGGRRPMDDWTDLVRNLDPATIVTPLQTALHGLGVANQAALDAFAKRFDRPLTVEQANHVRNNAALYVQPPVGAYSPADLDALSRGHQLGLAPPVASNYNPTGGAGGAGAYRSAADNAAHQQVLENALANAHNAATPAHEKVNSAAVVANLDTEALKKGGEMLETAVRAFDGRVAELADAYRASRNDKGTMEKMQNVIKEVAKASEKAAAKGLQQALSPLEARLVALGEEMKRNTVLKQVVQPRRR